MLAVLVMAVACPGLVLGANGITTDPNPTITDGPRIESQSAGPNCNLIDFEGMGCITPIGVVPGAVTVTFGASWLSIIDADDPNGGCSGNIANEPTPETVAFYLDTNDISIGLSPPVQFVEFWYVASAISLPVVVEAFDAGGNLVDTATGNTIGTSSDGAPCTGDPNGTFCLFDTITLNAASDVITSITISGTVANQFAIDNLQFCTVAEELGACCLDDGSCSVTSAAGCDAVNGTFHPGLSCADVVCDIVPVEQTTWGTLKSRYED